MVHQSSNGCKKGVSSSLPAQMAGVFPYSKDNRAQSKPSKKTNQQGLTKTDSWLIIRTQGNSNRYSKPSNHTISGVHHN